MLKKRQMNQVKKLDNLKVQLQPMTQHQVKMKENQRQEVCRSSTRQVIDGEIKPIERKDTWKLTTLPKGYWNQIVIQRQDKTLKAKWRSTRQELWQKAESAETPRAYMIPSYVADSLKNISEKMHDAMT
nr:hypothetical protein [Tanacetum cinerariifolium]